MRACHNNRAGTRDVVLVNVAFINGPISAVFAVENEREGFVVAHAEDDQGGEAFCIGADMGGVHAFAMELFADEAAHMFIPHPGDDACP